MMCSTFLPFGFQFWKKLCHHITRFEFCWLVFQYCYLAINFITFFHKFWSDLYNFIIYFNKKQQYCCFYHVTYTFGVNLHTEIAWMSRKSFLKTSVISEDYVTVTELEPITSQVVKASIATTTYFIYVLSGFKFEPRWSHLRRSFTFSC